MVEQVTVTGMVLTAMPVNEYDVRLVLLTKEKGKITVFAKGARRQNSPYLAGSRPFSFGKFTLYAGRSSYGLTGMDITEYFMELTKDLIKSYYGFYFLEIADYYGREGVDGKETLNLLYASFQTLIKEKIPAKMIRGIYELKSLVINGEYPDVFSGDKCGITDETILYAMQFVITQPIGKIFSFLLKEPYEYQFEKEVQKHFKKAVHKEFKSLEVIEVFDS